MVRVSPSTWEISFWCHVLSTLSSLPSYLTCRICYTLSTSFPFWTDLASTLGPALHHSTRHQLHIFYIWFHMLIKCRCPLCYMLKHVIPNLWCDSVNLINICWTNLWCCCFTMSSWNASQLHILDALLPVCPVTVHVAVSSKCSLSTMYYDKLIKLVHVWLWCLLEIECNISMERYTLFEVSLSTICINSTTAAICVCKGWMGVFFASLSAIAVFNLTFNLSLPWLLTASLMASPAFYDLTL